MKKVISREYKVMLRASHFAGNQRALARTAAAFWQDFARIVSDIAPRTHSTLGKVVCRRLITFLDTANHHLHNNDYIFRERRDIRTGKREVTLKFRHADRHVTQSRDMRAVRAKAARTKFEEDIKPPFVSLYSYSTTAAVAPKWHAKTLADVRRVFPDVRDRLDAFPADHALLPVKGFTALELVLDGASLRLGKRPKVDAECALIVWYDNRRRADPPVAVEFSYRYGDKREDYGGAMTRRAFDVFERIQQKLKKWVDPQSRTKTRFVYD